MLEIVFNGHVFASDAFLLSISNCYTPFQIYSLIRIRDPKRANSGIFVIQTRIIIGEFEIRKNSNWGLSLHAS